jgi:hypothetical protein
MTFNLRQSLRVTFVGIVMTACTRPESFMRLRVGNEWTYRYSHFDPDNGQLTHQNSITHKITAVERLNGRDRFGFQRIAPPPDDPKDISYWMFYRSGNLETSDTPLGDNQSIMNSTLPLPLSAGKSWKQLIPFQSTSYKVVDYGREINVPCGQFKCWLIDGLSGSAAESKPPNRLSHSYWSPGVGIIRFESYNLEDGKQVLVELHELESYRH